jgi:hypothetical protein
MQAVCSNAINGALAMAINVIEPRISMSGRLYRSERVALLLKDGSVWQIDDVLVPVGEESIEIFAAAGLLKEHRTMTGQLRWRMVSPARKLVKI